jgi:hypothetical protein
MFTWFIGTAIVTVWYVFRDPRFDYRLLVAGALLPPIADAPWGGAAVFHSLTASVAALALVVLATAGRRPIRRTLLGLPLGMLLHLVYTGAWTDTTVFWWPFSGGELGASPMPVIARGWWNVPLELIGIGLCVWIVRRARLAEPEYRRLALRTGQLVLTAPAR